MGSTTPRRVPLLYAAPMVVTGGIALRLAYPDPAIWPFSFIGVALILFGLWNQRGRHGAWLGMLAGGSFWFPLIHWLTLYLGLIPWMALAGAMTLWFTLMGAAVSRVTRWVASRRWSSAVAVVVQAVLVAGLWVAREQVQSSFPYGGFPWGRLAHTQAEGPLQGVVSYIGFAGLSALLVLLVSVPVATMMAAGKSRWAWRALAPLCALATGCVLAFLPPAVLPVSDTARVAAVQGNSKSGVFDDRENGDVIADHLRVTREWIATNPEPVDAVVWPENSAEYGISENEQNRGSIRELARAIDAPIAVGSILGEGSDEARRYTNSSLVIEPDAESDQRYDKRHPVPFAEYMPHRAFYRALAPDLVDMVQLEYEHGTTDTVMPVGTMQAGIAICFDIIFDDMAHSMIDEGAEIIFAPTNNADFGQTDQSEQQLFIAKLRAVETGRTVVNISTVATSAIVSPTGDDLATIPQWEPGIMESDVPLVTGSTPAMRYGASIAAVWILVGIFGCLLPLVRLHHRN